MGNSLNNAVIDGKSGFNKLLAVACYSRAFYDNIRIHFSVYLLHLSGYLVKRLSLI